jgi:hypothetical protein
MDPLDSFDFQNDLAVDEQVDPLVAQQSSAISDWDSPFILEANPAGFHLEAACGRVHGFAHAGPELTVNSEAAADGGSRELLEVLWQRRNELEIVHRFVSFVIFVSP